MSVYVSPDNLGSPRRLIFLVQILLEAILNSYQDFASWDTIDFYFS